MPSLWPEDLSGNNKPFDTECRAQNRRQIDLELRLDVVVEYRNRIRPLSVQHRGNVEKNEGEIGENAFGKHIENTRRTGQTFQIHFYTKTFGCTLNLKSNCRRL